MAHQGGNQSSRKRGYSGSKRSATAPDNKALAGREFFGPNQSDEDASNDDVDMGLPRGEIQVPIVNQDNNGKWVQGGPGPGVTRSRDAGGSNDPTPGGGW